jgi:hypothetical protein
VTTLSFHPRRFPGFCRGRARIVGFSLAIAALSLNVTEAAASDPSLQKKSHEKPYALIFGTVWGPDDKPVYGVKVKIRRENEKKARWEVYSDHNGEFSQRVPAGKADYAAWADLRGYKSINGNRLQSGDKVTIHVEYDERADTSLHLR